MTTEKTQVAAQYAGARAGLHPMVATLLEGAPMLALGHALDRADREGLSQAELCRRAGVAESTVTRAKRRGAVSRRVARRLLEILYPFPPPGIPGAGVAGSTGAQGRPASMAAGAHGTAMQGRQGPVFISEEEQA